ncbi:MAG: N-acetyltransferase [Anaerolineales bacterium]|nr:N-acetyltransferase [Anaerolineales bacterium]MCB0008156.1 N-acetyltransferase [Anaerolineales bacterium]MCB0013661.1 N-acetyltransferase [Anaerolineales bacterium]
MAHENVRIHATAEVSDQAVIGPGTSIWHQAQVRENVRIGANCILGKGSYVDFDVTIGDNCKLQNGVWVYHPAIVEDGVFLGPGVIVTNDKIPRAVNPDMSLKAADDWTPSPVTIRQGAAIGAGAILLPGVTVGRWAMVGSGAVVTKDVPDYGLVVGNPARLVGYVSPAGGRLERVGPNRYYCGQMDEYFELPDLA